MTIPPCPFTVSERTYRLVTIPSVAVMWACAIYLAFYVR